MASPLKFGVFSALKGVRDERAGKAAQQAEFARKRTLEEALRREHTEDRQRMLDDVIYNRSQRPAAERARDAQTAVAERTANAPYPTPDEPTAVIDGPDGPRIVRRSASVGQRPYVRPVAPKAVKARPLPAKAVEDIGLLDNLAQQGEEVIRDLDAGIRAGTNATGRVFGVIPTPNWVKNAAGMGGVEGENIRTKINNLFSTLAKQRGGTALSEPEIAILKSFIPNDDDPEPTALRKAYQFVREMKRLKQNKLASYRAYGSYDVGDIPEDEDDTDLPFPHD